MFFHRRSPHLCAAALLMALTTMPLILPISPVAPAVAETVDARKTAADRLFDQGSQHYTADQFQLATQTLQQALELYQQLGDRVAAARTLIMLGLVARNDNHPEQALKTFQQALQLLKGAASPKTEAEAFYAIGTTHITLFQYDQALPWFQQSLEIAKATGNKQGQGRALTRIGETYRGLNQYDKALPALQQAVAMLTQIDDRSGVGRALQTLGDTYDTLDQPTSALTAYQQALAAFQDIGDRDQIGTTLNNLGIIHRKLGHYAQALEVYQKALTIAKAAGRKHGEAVTLNNVGLLYSELGQYAQALEVYQQALECLKGIVSPGTESFIYDNLGTVYRQLGQYSKALKLHQKSFEIRLAIHDRASAGMSMANAALAVSEMGAYDDALGLYQRALTFFQAAGRRSDVSSILLNMGTIQAQLGHDSAAQDLFRQSLKTSQAIQDESGEATALNNLGAVADSLGQYTPALEFYQQALTIRRKLGDRPGEGSTLSNMAAAWVHLGKGAEAEQALFASIQILESLRTGLGDTDKVSIIEAQLGNYPALQAVLVAQGKTNQALEVSERSRARVFYELLSKRLSLSATILVNPPTPPTFSQLLQIAKSQQATLVEYAIVDPTARGDKKPAPSALYIWVIDPAGKVTFRAVPLKIPASAIRDLVTQTRQTIGARSRGATLVAKLPPDVEKRQREQQSANLKQLHNLLIAPIADVLPPNPNDRVIFIPQGELFLVPFPALQDGKGNYLIETHTILTAPSIQVLALTQQQRLRLAAQSPAARTALVVGNPVMPKVRTRAGEEFEQLSNLPGAAQEANDVAQSLGTQAITGAQARKAAIVQQMTNARFIHFATHGLLDDFKGLGVPGAIALAPDGTGQDNDGLLTSDEILDLKLNAELVVLSACDTGRGRITGDGVIGLSRSLITAGVPSIIVSLWKVPDASTAFLMTEFYKNLQQNPDKAQALRQAMLTTKQTYSDPLDWAAFTLIGEAE